MEDKEIREHMQAIEYSNDHENTVYYAACNNCTMEFVDIGYAVRSMPHFCTYKEKLDCNNRDEAKLLVAEMNKDDSLCPVCGKKKQLKVYSDADFILRDAFVKDVNKQR